MADPALKIVAPEQDAAAAVKPAKLAGRKRLRFLLLVALPLIAAVAGLGIYLAGGRYISTDNAYVGAQKVLITPDISGKVTDVFVKEGQHVTAHDKLMEIDPVPYQLALTQAKSKLEAARVEFNNLKTNLKSLDLLSDLAQKNVELKQRDFKRKQTLATTHAGTQADADTSAAAVVTAQLQAQYAAQQKDNTLNQLAGKADLKIEDFPSYQQTKAAVDEAQRNLDHTVLRAPIDGIATQVDNIQLGRFVMAGGPVFSVVDDSAPWVDANPKETDITYLRVGQKATIDIDTFPGHTFQGTVTSVSPGTGSQFSILPAQNASGNWVKVVQRVPLRLTFDKDEETKFLRSGMSATVEIDTGHKRSLWAMLGLQSATASTKAAQR